MMDAAEARALSGGGRARSVDFELVDGLEAIPVSSKLAARFKASGGMLVLNVRPASAAERSGFQSGDIIESINGQSLPEPDKAFEFLRPADSNLIFGIVRDGARRELNVAASNK